MRNFIKPGLSEFERRMQASFATRQQPANFANANGFGGSYGYISPAAVGPMYGYSYADAPAAVVQELPANQRTLTVTITNSNTASTNSVTLFNSIADLTDANLDADVTISIQQSPNNSHVALKTELLATTYYIVGAKYTVTTTAQFNNLWSYGFGDSSGFSSAQVISPNSYTSAQNFITTERDMADIELNLNGKYYLTFTLAASEVVQIVFYVKGKVDVSRTATGQSARVATDVAPPTGHLAFDFTQLAMRDAAMKKVAAPGFRR